MSFSRLFRYPYIYYRLLALPNLVTYNRSIIDMTTVYDVPAKEFIDELAKKLKNDKSVQTPDAAFSALWPVQSEESFLQFSSMPAPPQFPRE